MSSHNDNAPEGFKAPDRYFTPAEVELHNSESDLWVSWLGHVYDLTTLSEEFKGKNNGLNSRGYIDGSHS
jgi:cytochrome b involved in lipid metabolism